MTHTEIPAVGNLVTFISEDTWTDTPGEVVEVEDKTWPDLGGTPRRHVTVWVLNRITRRVIHVRLDAIVLDLGPLHL